MMYNLVERIKCKDDTMRDGNRYCVESADEAVSLIKRGDARADGFSCYVVPSEWNVEVDEVTANDKYNSE